MTNVKTRTTDRHQLVGALGEQSVKGYNKGWTKNTSLKVYFVNFSATYESIIKVCTFFNSPINADYENDPYSISRQFLGQDI